MPKGSNSSELFDFPEATMRVSLESEFSGAVAQIKRKAGYVMFLLGSFQSFCSTSPIGLARSKEAAAIEPCRSTSICPKPKLQ